MSESKTVPKLLTVAEFAQEARISVSHAYHIIRCGDIPSHFVIRFGRSIRVRAEALEGLGASA
ncbi:MAG: helix-turn-helix domain-containing protein [Peptococcaceae bacterium]|nr:helix-turn-helix domain-containing protein [Peptococcaceae bacterium]